MDAAARAAVTELGLTAAALSAVPSVPMHDADAPRIAIYSQWSGTQDLGWYRLTFDNLGIPYDLIFKEQVLQGNLRGKYDVILMAAQNINRQSVMQPKAARPQPYQKSEKYKFLGMYGETPDMSGRFRPARGRRVRQVSGGRRHADRSGRRDPVPDRIRMGQDRGCGTGHRCHGTASDRSGGDCVAGSRGLLWLRRKDDSDQIRRRDRVTCWHCRPGQYPRPLCSAAMPPS